MPNLCWEKWCRNDGKVMTKGCQNDARRIPKSTKIRKKGVGNWIPKMDIGKNSKNMTLLEKGQAKCWLRIHRSAPDPAPGDVRGWPRPGAPGTPPQAPGSSISSIQPFSHTIKCWIDFYNSRHRVCIDFSVKKCWGHRFVHWFFYHICNGRWFQNVINKQLCEHPFGSLFATFFEDRCVDAFRSPVGSLLAPFGLQVAPFGLPLAPFRLTFGTFSLPVARCMLSKCCRSL